jgi:hypothetical protein
MQWLAVALAWMSGAFWGDIHEIPVVQHTDVQNATVFALVVSLQHPGMPSRS